MKILLSAIACDPYRGSEAHFGWNALRALASQHDVWVLGHGNDTKSIERAREEGLIGDNVHFIPHGGWGQRHKNRIISRIQNWRDFEAWNRSVLETAQRLEREVHFDVAHHITLSTWRVPSPLWQLQCPFVWGPIGGAEVFPLRLLPILSPASGAYELLRRVQNQIAARSPALRACVRGSAHIFASTPETLRLVRRLGASEGRSSLLSAAFFTKEQADRLARPEGITRAAPPLRLFAGGDIEGRKGHALALYALAKCKQDGIDFRYHIAGQGPESDHLVKLAARLGIDAQVKITPHLRGQEYMDALHSSHIYLLPSLRDNAPVTLMEAMLAECVPIVIRSGGPGWIVDNAVGRVVEVANLRLMVDAIFTAVVQVSDIHSQLHRLGASARQSIMQRFTQLNFLEAVEQAYNQCI